MRLAPLALRLVAPIVLAGCMGNLTPTDKIQSAAQELNTAARFGRMDIALEHVARKSKDDFAKRHIAWGGDVRIIDTEMLGMAMRESGHAVVYLAVSWQRVAESEMRTTQVTQHWRNVRDGWKLDEEERSTGDVGLFGERVVVVRAPDGKRDVQFDSIVIR